LPVLFAIIFAIINFGAMLYNYIVVTNAAREGARWASIHTTEAFSCSTTAVGSADPCQIANSYAMNQLVSFSGTPQSTTTASGSGARATTVTVTMSYPYQGLGWWFSDMVGDISSTSIMFHE
jgi:Flp pilus assembly protein TadG